MSSGNQLYSVDMAEVICHFWSKYPSRSSCIYGPVLDVFWIWPHQVTKWSLVRNLDLSVNCSNLINCLDLGTKPTMNTESLSINNGSYWKIIKDLSAVFPWIWVSIFSIDFVIKAIYCCDLPEYDRISTLTHGFLWGEWFCPDIWLWDIRGTQRFIQSDSLYLQNLQ